MEEKKDGHGSGENVATVNTERKPNGLSWTTRDPETNDLVFHFELRDGTNIMRENFDACINFVSSVLWWVADYEGVFEEEPGLYDGFDWIKETL